jgi:hypothetical protein
MPPKPHNAHAPVIRVRHADLQRCSEESVFRVKCPVCKEGILLVLRDQVTFQIINLDCCVSCGQHVVYTDKFIGGEPVYEVHKDTN